MHILQLNSICSPATITISSHAYFFARAWLGAAESTEQRLKRVSESFWSHVKNRNVSAPSLHHKSCCDSSDVEDEPASPVSPSHFNHWITLYGFHMYIFWCMSTWFLYYLYKARSPFDSSHKTDWSHVNCKTQRQVVVINAGWHTAALNHRQIYPSPLWFLPQWFDLNLSWKKERPAEKTLPVPISLLHFFLSSSRFLPGRNGWLLI